MSESRRLELHEKLCEMLGSRNVYFQPPETVKLEYPCIIYSRGMDESVYADNMNYLVYSCWEIQIIAKDPTFELFDTFTSKWQYVRKKASFAADNLNHANYTLFY